MGMGPEDLLAELRGRLGALDALAAGEGDVHDLIVALLPEVPEATRRAVARATAERPEVAEAAHVDAAPPGERGRRLDVVAALAGLARHLDDPMPWQDRVDEVRYDLLARPHAWRDLSDHALLVAESLDLTDDSPHGSLLRLAARAALDAVSPELLRASERVVLQARRASRARHWREWLEEGPLADRLLQAVEHLEHNTLPLAAAEGAPDALARVRLGKALDGEVSLAVVPAGVVLEWDGPGDPPDTARANGHTLAVVDAASLAARAWLLPAPEGPALEATLVRGRHDAAVRWAP